MTRSIEVEVKVGILVTIGVGLVMMTILLLGGGSTIFQSKLTYTANFSQIEGLVEGATVKIAGVKVGQVTKVKLRPDEGTVQVTFSVAKKFKDSVHEDSLAGIQTQGVLGDRYIVITTGTPNSALAADGSELKTEQPKDFKDYLSNADEVLGRLKNSLAHLESILGSFRREGRAEMFFKNLSLLSSNMSLGTKELKSSMQHLNSVISKVDNGHGTIGALINDPSLYDDLKSLLGGANRNKVLKYFIKKSVEDSRDAAGKK